MNSMESCEVCESIQDASAVYYEDEDYIILANKYQMVEIIFKAHRLAVSSDVIKRAMQSLASDSVNLYFTVRGSHIIMLEEGC